MTEVPRNLALLGMMGVGKSTVARLLGQRLGRRVVETDDLIAGAAGMSIPEIFVDRGEPGFRELECEAVIAAASQEGVVIALGGGSVLDPANVAALQATSTLVQLRASPGALVERLRSETSQRPLLDPNELSLRISALASARGRIYDAVSDHTVEADAAPESVVDAILAWAITQPGLLRAGEIAQVSA